jgi:hypothetical protein
VTRFVSLRRLPSKRRTVARIKAGLWRIYMRILADAEGQPFEPPPLPRFPRRWRE